VIPSPPRERPPVKSTPQGHFCDDLPPDLRARLTVGGTSYGDRNRPPRQPTTKITNASIGDR